MPNLNKLERLNAGAWEMDSPPGRSRTGTEVHVRLYVRMVHWYLSLTIANYHGTSEFLSNKNRGV